MKWRENAGCISYDPELFFPSGGAEGTAKQEMFALSICRDCTVVLHCLKYALTARKEVGIWGGKTEKERREITKEWQKRTGQTKQTGIQFTEEFYSEISTYV
ncbi:MAG: WhiB family transcriptional regulator [Candidatus Ancillula sp.]|nr:WhiB family transcriptional regulator [Candidatus Ancillula sp.]